MYLVRLVYSSEISSTFSSSDIEGILEKARKTNKKINVTGMLCFNRKYFLQCLEGTRSDVNEIYHKILNDQRHKNITILAYKEIFVREFVDWSMGYIPESKLTAPINLKYSGTDQFKPTQMSGESADKLILELKDTLIGIV